MSGINLQPVDSLKLDLTKKQTKQIRAFYRYLYKKVESSIEKLSKDDTISGKMKLQQLKELQKEINSILNDIGQKVENKIKVNMYNISESIVDINKDFLKDIEVPEDLIKGAFQNIPSETVNRLALGKVYDKNWSLSKAIWGDVEAKKKDINYIIAEGIALNKSTYDIAKDLEKYVNPDAKKEWDWGKVYPGTSKKVDYNAQRLARTMVSHAYQQTFDATVEHNPFVEGVQWNNAHSNRVCKLCQKWATQDLYGLGPGVYPKGKEPRDHPNGMCFLTAVIPESPEDMAKRIKAWVEGEEDSELDGFAKTLYGDEELPDFKETPLPEKPEYNPPQKKEEEPKEEPKKEETKEEKPKGEPKEEPKKEPKEEPKEEKPKDNLPKKVPVNKADFETKKDFNTLQKKWLGETGFTPENPPSSFSDWSHKLSSSQKKELFDTLGLHDKEHPFQELEKWFNQNLVNLDEVLTPEGEKAYLNEVFLKPLGIKPSKMPKTYEKWVEKYHDELYGNFPEGETWSEEELKENYNKLVAYNLKNKTKKAPVKYYYEDEEYYDEEQEKYMKPGGFSIDDQPINFKDWYNVSPNSLIKKKEDMYYLKVDGEYVPFTPEEIEEWFEKISKPKIRKVKVEAPQKPQVDLDFDFLFSPDAYSQERKDAALWAKSSEEADNKVRDKCSEVWQNASKEERMGAYYYTAGSGHMNRPLRAGISWNNEHDEGRSRIEGLTNLINQSSYPFDMWLQRGVSTEGSSYFLHVPQSAFYESESKMQSRILGAVFTEEAFMSTGTAKGTGFGEVVIFNIYAPSGTKMLYCEPFSHYGKGDKMNWDGKSKQYSFGFESEMLIQRGSSFRVIKVEKKGRHWYIDMEVVGQDPLPEGQRHVGNQS